MDRYLSLQDPKVCEVVWPFHPIFDSPSHEANAFTEYRRKIGLPVAGLRGADLRECSCRGAMVASAGEQAGWHLSSNGWPRLVPEGLGELGHYHTAYSVQAHPFSSAAALSHSTLFAIDKIGELQEEIRG